MSDSKIKKIEFGAPLAQPEESDVVVAGPLNLLHDPAAQSSLPNEEKPPEKAEAPVTKKLGGLITLTEVALKRLQDGPYTSYYVNNGSTFYVVKNQMPGAYMKAMVEERAANRIRDIMKSNKQLRRPVPPPVPAESDVQYDVNFLDRNTDCGSSHSICPSKPARTFATGEVTRTVPTQYMPMTCNEGNREDSKSEEGLENQEKRKYRVRKGGTNCIGGGQPNPFIREHPARRSENLHVHKYAPVFANRNSGGRSSCHASIHRRSEQKPDVPSRLMLRTSDVNFQLARSRLDRCRQSSYNKMIVVSTRLNHLRLTKTVTREELVHEVDLLVASEVYNRVCQYQEQPNSIPAHWWQNTATVTLRDLAFNIKRPHPLGNANEHFVCVVSYEADVFATKLTLADGDVVFFDDVFQFQTFPKAFTITANVYSTQENGRTNPEINNHYLQKELNARKITRSNVVYHGSLTITQRHLQICGSFCHTESSRIGKASLILSMDQ